MKKSSAFTLVEILIVVGIIALITAIAIPNLYRAKVNANEAAARSTLKSISTALETYSVTNLNYPNNTAALIGASPPYLNNDYFSGTHQGYTYSGILSAYAYTVIAQPVNNNVGQVTYTLTTGGVISP